MTERQNLKRTTINGRNINRKLFSIIVVEYEGKVFSIRAKNDVPKEIRDKAVAWRATRPDAKSSIALLKELVNRKWPL